MNSFRWSRMVTKMWQDQLSNDASIEGFIRYVDDKFCSMSRRDLLQVMDHAQRNCVLPVVVLVFPSVRTRATVKPAAARRANVTAKRIHQSFDLLNRQQVSQRSVFGRWVKDSVRTFCACWHLPSSQVSDLFEKALWTYHWMEARYRLKGKAPGGLVWQSIAFEHRSPGTKSHVWTSLQNLDAAYLASNSFVGH